jgi:hypothetical protein
MEQTLYIQLYIIVPCVTFLLVAVSALISRLSHHRSIEWTNHVDGFPFDPPPAVEMNSNEIKRQLEKMVRRYYRAE